MDPMEKIRLILAARMKAQRKRLKINQDQAAELCNVSVETIGKIETCERWPQPETLEAIATGLGLEIPELLSDPSMAKAAPAPLSFHAVLDAYRAIPEDIVMDLSNFTKDSTVWKLVRLAIRSAKTHETGASRDHSAKS